MISGKIILEDITIEFGQTESPEEGGLAQLFMLVTITKGYLREILLLPQAKFFKALAIAVHNDGMPEYEKDYPDAESVMGKIRWIP